MIVGGRELILSEGFVESVLELEQWAGRQQASRGREMAKRLLDFAFDTIAPLPLSFPVYPFPLAPTRTLRRAIFDR